MLGFGPKKLIMLFMGFALIELLARTFFVSQSEDDSPTSTTTLNKASQTTFIDSEALTEPENARAVESSFNKRHHLRFQYCIG